MNSLFLYWRLLSQRARGKPDSSRGPLCTHTQEHTHTDTHTLTSLGQCWNYIDISHLWCQDLDWHLNWLSKLCQMNTNSRCLVWTRWSTSAYTPSSVCNCALMPYNVCMYKSVSAPWQTHNRATFTCVLSCRPVRWGAVLWDFSTLKFVFRILVQFPLCKHFSLCRESCSTSRGKLF